MKKISCRLTALLFLLAFGMFLTMAKPASAHPKFQLSTDDGDEEPSDGEGCVKVPELDPSAMANGLALCLGGTLLVLERVRRRRR